MTRKEQDCFNALCDRKIKDIGYVQEGHKYNSFPDVIVIRTHDGLTYEISGDRLEIEQVGP